MNHILSLLYAHSTPYNPALIASVQDLLVLQMGTEAHWSSSGELGEENASKRDKLMIMFSHITHSPENKTQCTP